MKDEVVNKFLNITLKNLVFRQQMLKYLMIAYCIYFCLNHYSVSVFGYLTDSLLDRQIWPMSYETFINVIFNKPA